MNRAQKTILIIDESKDDIPLVKKVIAKIDPRIGQPRVPSYDYQTLKLPFEPRKRNKKD